MSIDPDMADDLLSSFDEYYDELQSALNRLSHNTQDSDLINLIFRAIHTIKGNAAMMQVQPLVDFTHAMEETIDAIRSGNYLPTEKICDLLLTGTDRLKDLHHLYLMDEASEAFDETTFAEYFIAISISKSTEEAESKADEFYQYLYPNTEEQTPTIETTIQKSEIANHSRYLLCEEQEYLDLNLFRDLALQVDDQNTFWAERTDNLVYWGIKLAELSKDTPINKTQLIAAIYMHDVGMAFLPDDIVNKQAKLNAMEFKKLQQHVDWGYQLLLRMPAWEEAAVMVLQHHEKENGSGYPQGLSSDGLCEGAKIIAILDAFYAMTNLRNDRSHRRSVLRAISEINACTGTQFNEYWVNLFNQLIKSEVKKGDV